MTFEPEVKRLTDSTADYVFEVGVNSYAFKVKFSESYYQKLTHGRVSPEVLVKESFKFLLEHEGPESILREFELPLINQHFSNYESAMLSRL
jgi:hypothetical protein